MQIKMVALGHQSLLALLLTLHAVMEGHTAVIDGAREGVQLKHHCPSWTVYNSTSKTCVCGDPLLGIINCHICNNSTTVCLKMCYCMSYYNNLGDFVVGECQAYCVSFFHFTSFGFYRDVNLTRTGDDSVCRDYQRRGPMCGECEQNHAPPVYGYSSACVECSDYKLNWLKYIAVAYLPLTLFYFLVLILKISATTGSLSAFVTINQLAAAPGIVRIYYLNHDSLYKVIKSITTVCTVWNLDFFRSVYNPFCLHPSTTTIQVFSLDYLLGVYPLLLILVTYFFVKLHDRYSIVVFIWRPFYRCFSRFSRTLNIKASLVQAFATFILLSYVKILNVSSDILTPGSKYLKMDGHKVDKQYWYYNGSLEYFGKEHIPYAALAIAMSFTFNLLPLLLLVLYPFRSFRKLMRCLRLESSALKIFMDAFYGCYRTKPRDCRHFAAVYVLLRVANLFLFSLTRGIMYYCYAGYLFMLALVVVAIVRPYRNTWHNVADIVLFLSISTYYQFLNTLFESSYIVPQVFSEIPNYALLFIIFAILSIPVFFGLSLFAVWICPTCCVIKLKTILRQLFCCKLRQQSSDTEAEEELPYRLQQSTEYSPLIN